MTNVARWSVGAVVFAVAVVGLASWMNTRVDDSLSPADLKLHQLARVSDEVVVVWNGWNRPPDRLAPTPSSKEAQNRLQRQAELRKQRPILARLNASETRELLENVRLSPGGEKPLQRTGQYVLRFQRDKKALAAIEVYIHRGWITLEDPRANPESNAGLESPFEDVQVVRPPFSTRLRDWLLENAPPPRGVPTF